MEFKLDFDERKLQRGFVDIEKANSIAVRNTLNTMAAITRRDAVKTVGTEFINRNTFTKRQIQFEKTEATNIASMVSKAGATDRADYMALQETGGVRKTKNGGNLAIPQKNARGGRLSNLVGRSNYLRQIKRRGVTGTFKRKIGSSKARLVARAFIAAAKNKFLSFKKNIYSITSFTKSGDSVKFKKRHLYNTSEDRTRVKPGPWLEPATEKPIRDAQNIYNAQIFRLLKGDII